MLIVKRDCYPVVNMFKNNFDDLIKIIRSGHQSVAHYLKELAVECDDFFGQIKRQGLEKKFSQTA
jgi:hypothetical protein